MVVGFDGHQAPPSLLQRIADGEVGGVILFARNVAAPRQVAELTRSLAQAAPSRRPLLIAVDQEGGRVQRLRAPLSLWPPMHAVAARGDVELTRRVGQAIGHDLRALGFNLDFAPVLDVVQGNGPHVIGDRSFGSSPEAVVAHGLAFARGLSQAGVLPCGKHFPGHGGPVADSHVSLPVDHRSVAEIEERDLRPFVAAVDTGFPLLMSAHVVFPAFDADRPATLSHRVCIGLLRHRLGFQGALISDDMEMGAITGTMTGPGASLSALRAGVDLLLLCHREDLQRAVLEALVEAAGSSAEVRARLEEAAARVGRLKEQLPTPAEHDPLEVEGLVRAEVHSDLLHELESPPK
jgi:beta-N-acetylhexosaminidase